jgi:hypothetical protein
MKIRKIKPLYLLNVILTIVLLTSLLANAAINGSGTASIREYDPWKDMNLDGKINILDLVILAGYFGASGTPINTTALLLELQSRVNSLNASCMEHQSRINSLNASFIDLETNMTDLNALLIELQSRVNILNSTLTSQINDLKAQIAQMNATIIDLETMIATKLGKPDADSDWMNITAGNEVIFTHNLSTTNVLVYMIGKYSDSASPYIHQIDYGGELSGGSRWGVWWCDLTETTIRVKRNAQDMQWNWVRILVWKIPDSSS